MRFLSIAQKKTCLQALAKSFSLGFQDEEFQEMLHSSERIDFLYGHLFDEVIENADLSAAFEQLVRAVNRVETEPLWVPASWVQ